MKFIGKSLAVMVAATSWWVAQPSRAHAARVFLNTWGTAGTANGQFQTPEGIAVDGAGNVYVSEAGNHRIQKFSGTGTFLSAWGTHGSGDGQFDQPEGIAVDASGNVYVADSGNHRVQKFNSTGAFLATWGGPGGSGDGELDEPEGIAVDASGNVYVADKGNCRIQKFTSAGAFLAKWGTPGGAGGQFDYPFGVAVDASGNVYVADSGNHRVEKFTGAGTFLATWGTYGSGNGQFDYPRGLAVDADDNVYVTDRDNARIQEFTSSGTFLTTWGTTGSGNGQFNDPGNVVVDGGDVYVADTGNHRIETFGAGVVWTISASAGASGTITPSGEISVPPGWDQGFTVTPSANYIVADVVVDGSSVGPVSSYTFPGVTANHTIAASFVGPLGVGLDGVASRFGLAPAHPNPWTRRTTLRFTLAREGGASLSVYDLLGSRLREWSWPHLPAGPHEIVWDGRRDDGQPTSPGILFYRLEAHGQVSRRSMIRLQ